jgi:hypothetical protein
MAWFPRVWRALWHEHGMARSRSYAFSHITGGANCDSSLRFIIAIQRRKETAFASCIETIKENQLLL